MSSHISLNSCKILSHELLFCGKWRYKCISLLFFINNYGFICKNIPVSVHTSCAIFTLNKLVMWPPYFTSDEVEMWKKYFHYSFAKYFLSICLKNHLMRANKLFSGISMYPLMSHLTESGNHRIFSKCSFVITAPAWSCHTIA